MRQGDNIRRIEALGVDMIGMIFYPISPRYVSERPSYLPQKAKRVGVFVDAGIEDILAHVHDYGLGGIQLHGHETPDFVRELKQALGGAGVAVEATRAALGDAGNALRTIKILKAVGISNENSLNGLEDYEGLIDAFVFDTKTPKMGGSGRTFDHSVLSHYHGSTPFLLSGGLSLENADEILRFAHPALIGYDLNSRFETAPALKDPDRVRRFIEMTKAGE